jgi:hypothetical protein
MGARVVTVASLATVLIAACGVHVDGHQSGPLDSSPNIASVATVAPASAGATAPAVRVPVPPAAAPLPDAQGNPACPAGDAWGKAPSQVGILVTVWSDSSDIVTVLVRTRTGTDRAQTAAIGPDDHFRLFEFPDIDHTTVAEVLIITNVKRCYSVMDPATAAG